MPRKPPRATARRCEICFVLTKREAFSSSFVFFQVKKDGDNASCCSNHTNAASVALLALPRASASTLSTHSLSFREAACAFLHTSTGTSPFRGRSRLPTFWIMTRHFTSRVAPPVYTSGQTNPPSLLGFHGRGRMERKLGVGFLGLRVWFRV